ncbi:MAG TPA: HEAT repeat domain-containing protein [Candidatus Eisenbacteria bacterium]|nr:HEAT repeat domain-containing protein [Candidatus Eisenbacteria bacterium]
MRAALLAALVTAAAMIAYQVGARATRDALFLTHFPFRYLPAMMAGSSVLAIALAYASTRALTRWGPERVVPAAFAASGLLLLAEWLISFVSAPVAAVLLYLHYGCLGALLVSGFWSFVNERFDPRTAKRQLGRITAAGTVGGLVGGVTATQVAQWLPITAMMPILAAFHLLSSAAVSRLRLGASSIPPPASSDGPSGVRATARSPYIRGLITLVLLVTIVEGLIDLTLKSRAAVDMGGGGGLLRFFALYYTGLSLLTVVVQATLSRFTLEKLGPARAAAILPAGTAVAAAGAAFSPSLITAAIARGVEYVMSNSVYRGGYEVLFTPVPAREKRSIKALADVGASRAGDIVAAGVAQAVLLLPLARPGVAIMALSSAISVYAIVLACRLHAGYVQTLARGLVSRAVQLDIRDVEDPTTRSTVLQTLGPLALSQIFRIPRDGVAATPRPTRPGDPVSDDLSSIVGAPESEEAEELRRIRDLHSRDPDRVRRRLKMDTLSAAHALHLIPLLGWDDVARDAIEALRRIGPEATAPLVVALLDPNTDFAIRRRIPLVLATYRDPASVRGLYQGLADRRFEVRYRCGRALAHLADLDPSRTVSREEAFQAVLREIESGAGVWESRKILDRMDDEGWSPVMDEMLRDRANRSLEHVFTLLSLALPRQPLRIAFRGLHTDDPLLRGTALEYLESSLPPEIRRPLWPFLEDNRPKRPPEARPREQVLQDLLESNHSIVIRLEELRRKDEPEEPDSR